MKELIMKTTICGAALLLSLTVASCEVYESPKINQGLDEENNTSLYVEAYDPISNVGQYYMPEMKVNLCVSYGERRQGGVRCRN